MNAYNTNKKLTIPYPLKLERRVGVASLHHIGGPQTIRMHYEDVALLADIAKRLNMSPGTVARWLVVHGAQAIYKEMTGEHREINP